MVLNYCTVFIIFILNTLAIAFILHAISFKRKKNAALYKNIFNKINTCCWISCNYK